MPGATGKGVPYSVGGDLASTIDTTMQTLAEWVDLAPGTSILTTAERDALAGATRWTGRVIYNSTTAQHEKWNGAAWTALAGDAATLGGIARAAYMENANHTKAVHDALGINAATLGGLASSAFLLQSLADAAGDIAVATAADTWARKAKGADGTVLGVEAGVVDWIAGTAKAATGTYTGDGVSPRTIALPFTPDFVFTVDAWNKRLLTSSASGMLLGSADLTAAYTTTTNGFIVHHTFSYGNESGKLYRYLAVKA